MSAQPDNPAPVTVVVVDDSATQRRFVRAAMAADAGLEVVGEARNGRDAIALVERLRPTAVLMDLHLPVMNGIEAIERIMATRPTPIVVYSSFVDGDDRDNAANALAAGAIDVMSKPGLDDSGELEKYAEALRARMRVAGRIKVITHPRGKLGHSSSPLSTRRLGGPAPVVVPAQSAPRVEQSLEPSHLPALPETTVEVLAIGASTGGPQALARLLTELPADTSTAIVIVQHMADGFMEGLAHWLDSICPLPVAVGESGRRLAPGTVTVAPSGLNLVVHDQLRVTTHQPPTGQYHVPGIDATFLSVGEAYGAGAVGVILTGMGRDGAIGLKAMRDAGAFTIGQDEATSAVYGMPAAAAAINAVDIQLPLDQIGAVVARLVDNAPAIISGEPS